jgi:hypothetical protein
MCALLRSRPAGHHVSYERSGLVLNNLVCAPIMWIHAPFLYFSVSCLNCYPPLPLLMAICRSVFLPVERVLRCCIFVYWQRRNLSILLLLPIACMIHFTTTICCSACCMVCSISYFPIPAWSYGHSWYLYFLVTVAAVFVINY